MSQRLLFLGLDGADAHSVGRALEGGAMPTLSRLVGGNIRPLRSTPLPITPAAWTAAYTGMNPGKTGVLTWERRRNSYRTQLVNSRDVGDFGFHTRVAVEGRRVLSVGFPMMCPPPDTRDSIYLSGWDATPGTPLCNDARWLDRLSEFGYTLDAEFTTQEAELAAGIRSRFAIMRAMMAEARWDVGMLYLGFIDGLGHRLGFGNDLTQRMLALTDRELEMLLGDVADPVDFITCSDHGFGQFPRVFSVQQWLAENGYLTFQSKIYHPVNGGVRSIEVVDLNSGLIDWSTTKAFCTEAIGGFASIALNIKGAFEKGIVSQRDAYALAGDVAAALREACDPQTGERLVANVWRREELFWGHYANEFPELYVEMVGDTAAYVAKRASLPSGGYQIEEGYVHRGSFNTHLPDGIVGASFPINENAHIEDIAPTIYALLDLPIPSDVDGVNLSPKKARVEEYASHPAALSSAYSAEEEEIVRKRLEDLGYLG